MKRTLLMLMVIVGALAITTVAQSAQSPAKIVLQSQVEVATSEAVSLKDIAKIEAPTPVAAKIGDVCITSAPLPGENRPLEASYIKLKLSAAGFPDAKMTGSEKITVTGKCKRISAQQMADSVKEFTMGLLPQDKDIVYDVAVDRSPREMVLPDDPAVEIKPRLYSSAIHPGVNTIAIEAVLNGRTLMTRNAVARIKATANALMAVDAIPQGQALTEQNTKIEQCDVTNIKNPVLQLPGEDNAVVARRTIQAGKVITSVDVAQPPVIKSGDTVTVTVKCGSVSLRTSAEAKQDGHIGESIRVKSDVSSDDVRARVVGPGEVEISR